MPTYVYQIIHADGSEGESFEVFQRMSDPALTHHPETGETVRRVIQAANIPLKHTDKAEAKRISNDNLNRLGFTKYERAGDGFYEKKAGKGPDVISADD